MGGSNSNQLRLIFLFGKSILRYVLDVIRMTNTDHLRQYLDLHSQSGAGGTRWPKVAQNTNF